MSTRKFTLEVGTLPEIDSKLLFITASKYENDWPSFPHSHHFTEIFFVKKGRGFLQIEHEKIPIQENSLILIGARSQHTEFSDPGNPLDYYVIGVEGLKISAEQAANYSIIKYSEPSIIHQCFENILQEMRSKQNGYAEICQHYLAILILQICRKNHISYELTDVQTKSRECHEAKEYIETHYSDKITLDMLADECNLTKFYLSHKFSEVYGKSPMTYLTEVRIAAAKDLLKTTNHSIEEIAGAAGFSSSSYFSQTFQKICQMSPQQYRKEHKAF